MGTGSKFLKAWFIALAGTALLGGAINIVIDPYGLWDMPRMAGFNALKPQSGSRTRVVKPAMVLNIQPRTVIIGNSRPELGLDPEDKCWPQARQPVYSLTQPGSSVAAQLILATHSIEGTDAEYLFLGIDFSDYLLPRTSIDTEWRVPEIFPGSTRLLKRNFSDTNTDRYTTLFLDRVSAVFSLDALEDSIVTLFSQRNEFSEDITRLGFNTAGIFSSVIQYEGQGVLFEQKLSELDKRFELGKYFAVSDNVPGSAQLLLLETFLGYAAANKVSIVLFMNPLHSDYLDIIHGNGYWNEFERWKAAVTNIASKFDVQLWDFTDYDDFSTSTEMAEGQPKSLKWFWEPAHYTARLGHEMIIQFAPGCKIGSAGRSFGRLLTPSNIHNHLQEIRSNRDLHHAKANGIPKA